MPSIQDVANAAYLLGDQAKALAQQSLMGAELEERQASRLYALVRGSASGEQAGRQIGIASRAIRDSAMKMQTFDSAVQTFISDLTK